MTSRNWCFTLNNPTTVDLPFDDSVQFAVWQKERGENGTEHLQGYIEFKKVRKLAGLKKLFPTAHFEPRRGTQQQAIDYCRKDDTRIEGPWQFGEPKAQGKRNDLEEIKRKLDSGCSIIQIAEEHFSDFVRYSKGFREYKRLKTIKRDWKTEVVVYWGPTGAGKSRKAYEENPGAHWKSNSMWWDGYDGHETVVIDEFYGWLPFNILLRILDRYPLTVETKGGHVEFVAKKIVITSNHRPEDWYKNVDVSPLMRRLDTIEYMDRVYTVTLTLLLNMQ